MKLYKNYKIVSVPGLIVLCTYTLNEGLRYGRGVDYNIYGIAFERFEDSIDSALSIGYFFVQKIIIELGGSYQVCILLMSLMFIIGTLWIVRGYRELAPLSLPIFILLTINYVENMARWFLAYSIFLIGLYYIIVNIKNWKIYIFYSVLACCFHYAFLPIPIIFFIIRFVKKVIISPSGAIAIFFIIAFTFQTEFMLIFTDLFTMLTFVSSHYGEYANNAEDWLTAGFGGRATASLPGMAETLLICATCWLGYKVVKRMNSVYIYAYNLFLIGMLLYPIGNKIELIQRYGACFLFFRAFIIAAIIQFVFIERKMKVLPIVKLMVLLLFSYYGLKIFYTPFTKNPDCYLYVWNSDGKSYDDMIRIWISESEYESKKIEKK